MGTPWEIGVDGSILFFEDVKAPPYYVDGFLNQLMLAGKLQQAVGVVVGEMKDCDWGDLRASSDWASVSACVPRKTARTPAYSSRVSSVSPGNSPGSSHRHLGLAGRRRPEHHDGAHGGPTRRERGSGPGGPARP